MNDTATSFADIAAEVDIPTDGTLSRVLYRDTDIRVVVFAFDAGQELTEHTSSAEVIVQVVSGRITLTVEGTAHLLTPASWLLLEPRRPHSLRAEEPSIVLLTLVGVSRS